jgi:transaldolase
MHLSISTFTCRPIGAVALLLCIVYQSAAFTPPHRGESRFFLDTADTNEWDELLPRGLFHGVTTNPTLLERAKEPCTIDNLHLLASKALSYTEEFMCQTWGGTVEEMYENGMRISDYDRDRVVVKVPVTVDGVVAAAMLAKSGVRICLTACYNSKQALIAASAGVEYIAPYLGR